MQLAAEPAGPYKLTVWTSPDPAETGEIHVAVAVVLAEDASPVLDALVSVQMKPVDGGATISSPATTEDSENKFLYEAVLDVGEAGDYEVVLVVEGADGQPGQASFNLDVAGGSGLNWLPVVAILLAVGAVIVILLIRRRPAAA